METGTWLVKSGMAQMLKGGVIMDVVTPEQARIAEDAGAVAVMALERVPADIRSQGGVARMSDPELVTQIKQSVTIPVMAKCRIGHFVEAQVLEALGIDYIDESEVLTPADEEHHIAKDAFTIPFVCGARDLGEALRRIGEGAAMIRTKGEAGTGNVVEAVRHIRAVGGAIRRLQSMRSDELMAQAKEIGAPYSLVLTARGTSKTRLLLHHTLPNASVPLLHAFGITVGALLGGATIVESIFSWPGIGQLMIDAVNRRDLPVVQGYALVATLAFVATSTLMDIATQIVDPRLRHRR